MMEPIDFSACERLDDVLEAIELRSFVDPVSRKAEIAPAYDFGSCLLPQADDDVMRRFYKTHIAARHEVLFGR